MTSKILSFCQNSKQNINSELQFDLDFGIDMCQECFCKYKYYFY